MRGGGGKRVKKRTSKQTSTQKQYIYDHHGVAWHWQQLFGTKTKQGLVCLRSGRSEKTSQLSWQSTHEGGIAHFISVGPQCICCFPMYIFLLLMTLFILDKQFTYPFNGYLLVYCSGGSICHQIQNYFGPLFRKFLLKQRKKFKNRRGPRPFEFQQTAFSHDMNLRVHLIHLKKNTEMWDDFDQAIS